MANKKFSQFTNGGPLVNTDTIVGLRAGVNTKFSVASIVNPLSYRPALIFYWDPINGNDANDGGELTPFQNFLTAYTAGAAIATEILPVTIIGSGNQTFGNWAIAPFVTVSCPGDATTHFTCTGTISASAAWSTPPSVLRNFVNLSGFTFTANAINISVDQNINNQIGLENLQYIASGAEEINLQGFSDGFVRACNFGVNTNYIGSSVTSVGNIYYGFVSKTGNISTCLIDSIGDTFQTIDVRSHEVLSDGFTNGTKFFAPNMANVSTGAFTYSGANTGITITGDSIVPTVSGPGIGAPAAPTYQTIGDNIESGYPTPVNYTAANTRITAQFAGIDAALAGAINMNKVYVTGGYQLVAPNTIYYTRSPGKVIFQIPAIFPKGSIFQIIGASESQNGWELWTHLGQSLIYQNIITDIAPNIYAVAYSNYYRDTATFTAIDDNVQIQCIQYDGAGLQINEEISVDIPLTTVTSTPSFVYATALIISGYAGYLARVFRSSDSAVAFVMPDFANRASLLSDLDVGGKLADWGCGTDVSIQFMDQSGNGFNATESGSALWIDAAGNVQNIDGRPAARTAPAVNYMQGTFTNYTGSAFTIMALATRTNSTSYQSSIATLYNPANGDDYASSLDNVCFYEDNPTQQFISVRNANLSTTAIPAALDTRMVLSNKFDGANNTMTVNGVSGTTPASTGAFSFNKILIGARYVSGGITTEGSYHVGFMAFYPSSLSPTEISDLTDYINLYL